LLRGVKGITEKFVKTHYIDQIDEKLEGQKVKLVGWVYAKRTHGRLIFLTLRDSTGLMQVTVNKERVGEEEFKQATEVTVESSVAIEGNVRLDQRAPGGVEVQCSNFNIIALAAEDYPIRLGASKEFLLDKRHLHIRSPRVAAALSVRSTFCEAAREWFKEHRFKEVHCPILITAACEGGSTLFPVEYFKRKAYLSQSVQLYQEAAITSFEKVYSIEPSFRAELSRTRRHLTEFWQIEAEAANADLEDIMRIQEDLVTHICQKVVEECNNEFRFLKKRFKPPQTPFIRITYAEAIERLQSLDMKTEWGEDLGADEERALSKQFKSPFFIQFYPRKCKAFYHKPSPDDPELTLSADLMAPDGYGEIAGGGQRIDDHSQLTQSLKEFNLNPKDYQWYLDLRKYGSVVHSGFGLGVERTVQWILKLPHVREIGLFPRTPARVYP